MTPFRLSDLLRCGVVTEDRRRLGHVYDVRARTGRNCLVVTELVFGIPGLPERLGLKEARMHRVSWDGVVKIENDTIVVDRACVQDTAKLQRKRNTTNVKAAPTHRK